jgi:hypothetical protein
MFAPRYLSTPQSAINELSSVLPLLLPTCESSKFSIEQSNVRNSGKINERGDQDFSLYR